MKIVITGHTSGLGKALYDGLSEKHEVLGLSRQNGHDLSVDLYPFLIDNFDVYINNAYYKYAQVDLLYQILKKSCYLGLDFMTSNPGFQCSYSFNELNEQ